MKQIELTKGKFSIVDDGDFEFLNQWKWCITAGYAFRKDKRKNIYMHQIINNTPDGFVTDHINCDKLDNRRENLRTLSRGKNQWNRSGLNKNNKSGFNGVFWDKLTNKWLAHIEVYRKNINLGRFLALDDAVNARKSAERHYYEKEIGPKWGI